MTYIVNEKCVNCRFTDCVEVCPVDCFYIGENTIVIHPDECIDCGVCEPECPAGAIVPDTDMNENLEYWLEFNTKYSQEWPNITQQIPKLADADAWNGDEGGYAGDKRKFVSTEPGPEE